MDPIFKEIGSQILSGFDFFGTLTHLANFREDAISSFKASAFTTNLNREVSQSIFSPSVIFNLLQNSQSAVHAETFVR